MSEADDIWELIERRRRERAERLPTVESALLQIHQAHERLKELGFRDAMYAPNDGQEYEIVEFGSTGVHIGRRQDVNGGQCWWIESGGDLWPSHPVMWRRWPIVGATPDTRGGGA